MVYQTSLDHLGLSLRKHQDWFDENNEEILDLLEKKHQLHKTFQNDPSSQSKRDAYNAVRRTVQAKLRKMKDKWYSTKAEEIQSYAESNNSRCFYNALKTIYGPQSSGSSPVLSADGNTLYTDKEMILKRWAEHFNNVLNRPSSINEAAIARLPQVVPNMSLINTVKEDEVLKATNKLLNGKAPGADAIPGEIFKKGGPKLITKLTELFNIMLHQEVHSPRIQRCITGPLVQEERKQTMLRQPQRHLSACNCWQNPSACATEQASKAPRTRPESSVVSEKDGARLI